MSQSLNQEWAIARWREDAARNDPQFYTVRKMFGSLCIWLKVEGNVGWYRPEVAGGSLVGIRSISLPQPDASETERERKAYNYLFPQISPKQSRKIVGLASPAP